MLITTCAHCRARFRVTPTQLNARQGHVRCGVCRKVFNGFEALERHPDDDTGSRLLAAREVASSAEQPAAEMVEGIETLQAALAEEAKAPAPPQPPQPPAAGRRPATQPQRFVPDVVLTPPEPPPPPSRAWRFAAGLLALVFATELAYGYRSALAQRYPLLRSWLESGCELAGCAVSWGRDNSALKLEDSELLEIPGKPNEIALAARMRNLGAAMEEYPYIELTLTDITGQAAVRRVLRPSDYLGRPPRRGEGLAPGADIALQLRLETPRIKATGYELLLFYP